MRHGKHRLTSVLGVLLAGFLALGTAACAPSLTATELTTDIKPASETSVSVPDQVGRTTYDFSLDLLRACVKEDAKESVLVSPLSVLNALALAENGAAGETLAQIEQATDLSADELTDALQTYAQLVADDESPLSPANSIWLRDTDELSVHESFLEACGGQLGAQVFTASFDSSTVSDINAWVSDRTHGMIPEIVSEIPPSTMLYLINALAFEGTWADPFDEALIEEDTFTCEDGTEQSASMMHSTESSYLENDQAEGFIKPYESFYSFVGLLPKEGVSVGELLEGLDGGGLSELLTPVDYTVAQIGLPRFSFAYDNELTDELSALGVTDAFDPERADFSRMGTCESGPLSVGMVLHKTYIDVNEGGTRAAAVTGIGMDESTAPANEPEVREVILDRPFVYLIVDQRTGTPAFIGTVMDME